MKVKLKELYERYQFGLEEDAGECLVFGYRSGFFRNIEIVMLKNTGGCREKAQRLEQDYRDAGWGSVGIVFYAGIAEAEKKLFDSFFYIEESRKRLEKEYDDFCCAQTERLKNKYSYIEGKYSSMDGVASSGLVEHIAGNAQNSCGRLTILEAAAGYGKTCTVYEILNRLLKCSSDSIPLFIELSKNRMASIFLYVLQNEINDKFTQLSTELVIHEIKTGRIPLIIDGFDELLQGKKPKEQEGNPDEQSISMLSTIADLLGGDSKAWILLTSRRSALFTGDIFEEWVSRRLGEKCVVERLQILKPSAKDWLGREKYDCMREKNIAIDNISNPVLLTLLRNRSIEEVRELLESEDGVLSKYFELLLEREQTRQDLNLSVRELYQIMERLAALFVQYEITSESRDFIRSLLRDIVRDKLMEYRTEYRQLHGNETGMPSDDEYIGKILINSLLDRVSMTRNEIGFINEFILGILVGEAVCDGLLTTSELTERFIDISATAFSVRGGEKRCEYYGRLKEALDVSSGPCRLNAELNLLRGNGSDYKGEYFSGVYFPEYFVFTAEHGFSDCVFSECVFDRCRIQGEAFGYTKFFNCQFIDINAQGATKECVFGGCTGYESLESADGQPGTKEAFTGHIDRYEKLVLEQFWKPGYNAAELRRTYTALFKGMDSKDYKNIEAALKSLIKRGLLRKLNVCYEMNTSKMAEIQKIVERGN